MEKSNEKSVERQIAESDLINGLKRIGAEKLGTDFLALSEDEQLAITTTMGLANALHFDKADFRIVMAMLTNLLKADRTSAVMLCIAICENAKKMILRKMKDGNDESED